jgi:hypothetical protein
VADIGQTLAEIRHSFKLSGRNPPRRAPRPEKIPFDERPNTRIIASGYVNAFL